MFWDLSRTEIYMIIGIFIFILCIANRIRFMVKGKLLKAKVKNYVVDPQRKEEVPLMEFMYHGELLSMIAISYRKMKYMPGTEFDIYYIPEFKRYVLIKKDYSDIILAFVALALVIVLGVYWFRP